MTCIKKKTAPWKKNTCTQKPHKRLWLTVKISRVNRFFKCNGKDLSPDFHPSVRIGPPQKEMLWAARRASRTACRFHFLKCYRMYFVVFLDINIIHFASESNVLTSAKKQKVQSWSTGSLPGLISEEFHLIQWCWQHPWRSKAHACS